VTFGAYKPGCSSIRRRTGRVVEFVDIGLAALPRGRGSRRWQAADVDALLPRLEHETDKYGAAWSASSADRSATPARALCVGGALRSGVGAVRYSGAVRVGATYPEVQSGGQRAGVGGRLRPIRDELASGRLEEVSH